MWLYCLIGTKVRNKEDMRAEKGEIPCGLSFTSHLLPNKPFNHSYLSEGEDALVVVVAKDGEEFVFVFSVILFLKKM